jgi:two-component system NarL family sensor kinase
MQKDGISLFYFAVITTLVVLMLLIFVVALLVSYKRKQDLYFSNLQTIKINHEKELLKMQLEVQEETILSLSREIHDNIGQYISLAAWQLNSLRFTENSVSHAQIENVTSLLGKVLDDLRGLSKSMNPDFISKQGLFEAISEQVGMIKNASRFNIELNIIGEKKYLEERTEIIIYRIFQEAINNIVKHSEADHVDINFNYTKDQLILTIKDNGYGFPVEFDENDSFASTGSGLNNMRKRAKLINAEFSIHSEQGKGTTVILEMPCKEM